MKYFCLKNLRAKSISIEIDPSKIPTKPIPKFKDKPSYRQWCADKNTDYCFFSGLEGSTPSKRIDGENKVIKIHSIVCDYDAPVDWANVDDIILAKCSKCLPTWRARTFSGYIRLVFELEEVYSIAPEILPKFYIEMKRALGYDRAFAKYDKKSENAAQYFALGDNWVNLGGVVPNSVVQTAILKAAASANLQSQDTSIPIEIVAKEVEKRFPNRWVGEFEIGSRGPLFWVDDGIDREGCQVFEDGMVVYSDRANGWTTWREIFGSAFVKDYEEKKMGTLLDEYWFNGKNFYTLINNSVQMIPKDQLILELKQRGFRPTPKKGDPLSEIESATLVISRQNRVNEVAPVVFKRDKRIVEWNGQLILNTADIQPLEAAESGNKTSWPFLYKLMTHMFVDDPNGVLPSVFYFWGWHKRFWEAVLNNRLDQGHTLVLCGPAKRGKTLLATKVIASSVGGYADASDYLSGQTKFNKELGRVACWVIDDTTSAASYVEQRRLTEMLKRATANPRVEFMAKYADSVSLPWAGRPIMSLNNDANSMSVIPSLDSSNRDKLMAFRISEKPFDFPKRDILEATIKKELPHYLAFLRDYKIPKEINTDDRFGVSGFIDPSLSAAAYDSSTRARAAEVLDLFSKECRIQNPKDNNWRGTYVELQVALKTISGSAIGGRIDELRRDITYIEELCKTNKTIRPVKSVGKGGGKILIIDVSAKYDIDSVEVTETEAGGDIG